jgi:hypothetical protein
LNVVEGSGLLDQSGKINAYSAELDNLAFNYTEQEEKLKKSQETQKNIEEENLLLVKEN